VVAQRPAEQKFQRQVMERRFRLGKPTLVLRQEFLGHSVGIHRKAGEPAQWRPSTVLTFEQQRCIFPRPPDVSAAPNHRRAEPRTGSRQRHLDANKDSARVLGRVEAAKAHRGERADADLKSTYARASGTASFHRPCALRISSMTSRAAPRPPPRFVV
jgi:hypothetical protein